MPLLDLAALVFFIVCWLFYEPLLKASFRGGVINTDMAIVRAGWMRLWDTIHLPLGADPQETTTFLAQGMLINCLVAMGFPADHRVWAGLAPPESGG